ncbi:MAG: glycine--tRNA ligase [Pseudomonadota bacterium]|nr:glycine--tRNA ligase [Pseudomonadota bacterium]
MSDLTMDQIVSLCKRRGFFYPSWHIYGGLQGTYDYGPMGAELRKNLQDTWWHDMLHMRQDMHGLHTSILSHQQALYYSGHTDTFNDMMIDCKTCKARWRTDHEETCNCKDKSKRELTEPRAFNLMFQTQTGPVASDENKAYLRPETAQGIFCNFKNILDSQTPKLPFGVAQIGKAFRNEVTPRNFIFRVREFEQMEIEFFVKPGEDQQWHQYWVDERFRWWQAQGLHKDNLVQEHQTAEELAHYAKNTTDILYRYPHGTEELEGIANRTDYDLGSHSKEQQKLNLQASTKTNTHSTARLALNEDGKWFAPYVIEPSCGVERGILAILSEGFCQETLENGQERTVLKIKPHLSPIKVAIIPLAKNKPDLVKYSRDLHHHLQSHIKGLVVIENSGNIGKNYRRHDEIGTPCCITVDFNTLADTTEDPNLIDTVTVRDRDSLEQTRIHSDDLVRYLQATYFDYSFVPTAAPNPCE